MTTCTFSARGRSSKPWSSCETFRRGHRYCSGMLPSLIEGAEVVRHTFPCDSYTSHGALLNPASTSVAPMTRFASSQVLHSLGLHPVVLEHETRFEISELIQMPTF